MDEYKFTDSTSVNKLWRYISWDADKRDILFSKEGFFSKSMGGSVQHTWTEENIAQVSLNYQERIKSGKVKVFYVDLVEHLISELGKQLEKKRSFFVFNMSAKIRKINRF